MPSNPEMDQVFERSKQLHEKAKAFLPGGVTGDGRSSSPFPILMQQGRGKRLVDVDGNEYLDFHGGFGTAILGYAHPEVDAAVKKAIDEVGAFVGVPHPYEGALAERLCAGIPGMDRVAFCGGGGSDAVYHCVRLARAATGRSKIVKLEGGYHGWHSDVAVNTRPDVSGEGYVGRPETRPASLGILQCVADVVAVVTINDQEALRETFGELGSEIAAIILEPVVYSSGCINLDQGFLQLARELCNKNGNVLIFDEVMSGFRNGIGGAGARQGVVPDLGAYGKAVANGHMLSFLGGSEELMTQLSPEGRVLYSGTFNGHPVAIAAAQATLDVIERDQVPEMIGAIADRIAEGINSAINSLGARAVCQSYGSVWNVYFNAESIRNYRELAVSLTPQVEAMNDGFRTFLRINGVYMHKRHVNRCFVSAQHDEQDVERTVSLVTEFIEANLEKLAA
jgi:glutamate-1-semialdehyde 2,1-aminomutase